ncbi:MAG: hypothetical protein AAF517_26685 [Planctomycetota bacterium]
MRCLVLVVALATWSCTPRSTSSSIEVTYDMKRLVATAVESEETLGTPASKEKIAATIKGDATHSSHLGAEVYSGKDNGEVVLKIPSPGHAGTETLTLTGVSASGSLVKLSYEKTSPQVNTADFRQFYSTIKVTFRGD